MPTREAGAPEWPHTLDVQPGVVVRVLRPGYGDATTLLRPAVVAVSGAPDLDDGRTGAVYQGGTSAEGAAPDGATAARSEDDG